MILKRSKIQKNWREATKGKIEPVFFEPHDFVCGEIADIYGRYYLLMACDDSTHQKYMDMGHNQRQIDAAIEKVIPIERPIPKAGDGFRPQRPLHPGKTGDGFRPANPALSLSMSKRKGRNLGPVNPPPGGRRVGLSGTGIRVQIGPRCGASWGPVQCPRKSSFLGTDDDWNTTYTHTTTHQPVCRGWWVVSALQSTL